MVHIFLYAKRDVMKMMLLINFTSHENHNNIKCKFRISINLIHQKT